MGLEGLVDSKLCGMFCALRFYAINGKKGTEVTHDNKYS
jgi:hypothetical protein